MKKETVLHYAAAGGRELTARTLIEDFGAQSEATTTDGNTALHLSCENGHESTALLLIRKFEANKKTTNQNGKSALALLLTHIL
ncbi:hypothetical protein EDC01DRAFT_682019 [Geopyxis carbonaria]|nr:hypothetical protein EDC01DRAFT_682019 [Geopyxis carbonaria]